MKYLKKFESVFGISHPQKINSVTEFLELKKSKGMENFNRVERETLENFMTSEGRQYKSTREFSRSDWTWEDSLNFYDLGTNYLSLNYQPKSSKFRFHIDLYKCEDDYFYIQIYETHYSYERYFECDGFDCAIELLKNELNR